MCVNIATFLAGVKTAQEFFRAKETSKKDVNYFIDRFDGFQYCSSRHLPVVCLCVRGNLCAHVCVYAPGMSIVVLNVVCFRFEGGVL